MGRDSDTYPGMSWLTPARPCVRCGIRVVTAGGNYCPSCLLERVRETMDPEPRRGVEIVQRNWNCPRCGRGLVPSPASDNWFCENPSCAWVGTLGRDGRTTGDAQTSTAAAMASQLIQGGNVSGPATAAVCATCNQPLPSAPPFTVAELRQLFYALCADLAPHETAVSLIANDVVMQKRGTPIGGSWLDWLRWLPEIAERARRELNITTGIALPPAPKPGAGQRVIELED